MVKNAPNVTLLSGHNDVTPKISKSHVAKLRTPFLGLLIPKRTPRKRAIFDKSEYRREKCLHGAGGGLIA